MRRFMTVTLIACTLTLSCAASGAQDLRTMQSSVAKRAVQALDAINDGRDAHLREFVQNGFAQSVLKKTTVDEWVRRLLGVIKAVGTLSSPEVVEEKADQIIVRLHFKDGELGMRLKVETQPPFGITAIAIGPLAALMPPPKHRAYDKWTNAQDLLDQVRADFKIPAIALAIYQDGKLIDQAVSGVREAGKRDEVRIQDRWLIGSNTKSMTATLIAVLIERGKLRWDMTLAEALPKVKMRPEYRSVTLEQVMHHRGGIPQDLTMDDDDVARVVGKLTDPRAMRSAYVVDMLNREPVAKPGEKTLYSNAGYTMLGAIAEQVMGKPYEDLMRDLVFKPLGMNSAIAGSSGRAGQPGSPGQPQGHEQTLKEFKVHNFTEIPAALLAPAGIGVSCTVADLAKYANFHLQGLLGKGGLLKPETVQRLHAAPEADQDGLRYACGWVKADHPKFGAYDWHNGSDGTFFADMAIWPKAGLVVVAITNTGWAGAESPTMLAVLAVATRLLKP